MNGFGPNNSCPIYESISESAKMSVQRSTRQSLQLRFDQASSSTEQEGKEEAGNNQRGTTWCEGFSLNVNPKQAFKNGAEKLTQTFNSVKTTFGTLSQKLRKSTRRRQPLTNVDSPVTPYTHSRHMLGRTPTKMYSPFGIDTPQGKENCARRSSLRKPSPAKSAGNPKRRFRTNRNASVQQGAKPQMSYSPQTRFNSDLEQTQIGIYEFQSTANRIIRRSMRQ